MRNLLKGENFHSKNMQLFHFEKFKLEPVRQMRQMRQMVSTKNIELLLPLLVQNDVVVDSSPTIVTYH